MSKTLQKRKPTKSERRTHILELALVILLVPNCLALIIAAALGALFNSPVIALITGVIAWIAQVVFILAIDKKYYHYQ